jgi:uncharacterized protein
MTTIPTDHPLAVAATEAIHAGEVAELERLLADHPELATARLGGGPEGRHCEGMTRTLLHVATDWPGRYPNGAGVVGVLVAAGADVNARFAGPHTETSLHWAASSDDVEVLDALLDAGADIEAVGAVIGGGTPLDDAVAFGQWNAARRLVERGAKLRLWHAAALGRLDILADRFAAAEPPGRDDVTEAFWAACHGGQREAAEYLLDRGADRDWIGYDGLTPLDVARRSGAHDVAEWLESEGAASAQASS